MIAEALLISRIIEDMTKTCRPLAAQILTIAASLGDDKLTESAKLLCDNLSNQVAQCTILGRFTRMLEADGTEDCTELRIHVMGN